MSSQAAHWAHAIAASEHPPAPPLAALLSARELDASLVPPAPPVPPVTWIGSMPMISPHPTRLLRLAQSPTKGSVPRVHLHPVPPLFIRMSLARCRLRHL